MPRNALLLLAVGLTAAPVSAQTLDEVVAGHVAARGGRERLAAIQSLRMSGRATAGPGREALVSREVKRPGRIRTEFVYQGMTAVYVFDGQRGWQIAPFAGSFAPEPMPEEAARLALEQADIDGPLVDWKAKGHRVELVGREKRAEREVLVLELALAGGAARRLFLDASSLLLVRMESTRSVRGREVALETAYSDYREVAGVLFPHAIETTARDRPGRLSVRVESIEANPPLDDARFELPAALR